MATFAARGRDAAPRLASPTPPMEPNERFARNLREHRQRAGLSQERLGFRANLHRTEISLLERGAREPRLSTIVRLARALGVAPGDFVDGIE